MKSHKKISLFISGLPFGGTERVVSLISNALSNHYEVILILKYNVIEFKINENVKIIILNKKETFPKSNPIKKAKDFLKFIYRYNKVIKHERIDLAFSFLGRQNIINSIAKMLKPNLKTIISERCFPSLMYNSNKTKLFIIKRAYSLFYNRNDALFSNSLHINEDLKNNFNIKIPMSVIYNPIENNIIQKSFLPYNPKKHPFKAITVGRLTLVKNQKSSINAISLLTDNYELNIYGEGILMEDLTNLINSLKLQNQVFLRGTDPQINMRLKEHHCFILCSLTEGFPNVILEAMASGTPVISTNCKSGPLELLNDNEAIEIPTESFAKAKYGILVNVDDSVGLSKAIKYLKENEDIRKKYSDLAFEKAKKFDIKHISKELTTLIESLD